jgi:hypothetical protein
MLKDIRHRSSFIAVDDNGNSHRLHVFVEIIDASTQSEPGAETEGLKQIRTEGGQSVNWLEKGRYEVVTTGMKLRSDDPLAP